MIISLTRFDEIVGDDRRLTLRAANYIEELTRIVNLNTPIQGTGSPEGVVTAEVSQMYMDTAGVSESVLYIKQTGSDEFGWILG